MKRNDIILSLITGEATAWFFIWMLKESKVLLEIKMLYWLLPILFPVSALIGLWFSYLIGKRYLVVYQLAKFLLVGACFAIFDLIILNILLEYFGISQGEGIKYAIFTTTSFIIATTVKYVADKYWVFGKAGREQMGIEFSKFFVITLISGIIHVGVASLIFAFLSTLIVITELVAGNIGKIGGITIASVWNFLGYKFIVFKK